ncbi:hypothetical protein QJQ45_009396 [Haematococcus lacustris]|nr:hypothetical protein QJQ45_009396 [Haematococcus lacustris]
MQQPGSHTASSLRARAQHAPASQAQQAKAEQEAEPTQTTKGKGKAKGKAANRIGESKWRPLELCWWPEQEDLPAKGKEYPGLGYKRVRDKPLKPQQQQPAGAQ